MPSYWTTELRRNYWLRSMHWAGRYVSKVLLFFSASDWAQLVLLRCCWVRPVSCVSEVNAPPYRYTLFTKHSSKSYGLTIKSFILLLQVALTFNWDKNCCYDFWNIDYGVAYFSFLRVARWMGRSVLENEYSALVNKHYVNEGTLRG